MVGSFRSKGRLGERTARRELQEKVELAVEFKNGEKIVLDFCSKRAGIVEGG
jgi:hypothetical protein